MSGRRRVVAAVLVVGSWSVGAGCGRPSEHAGGELQRLDAYGAVLGAMDDHPLVALGEFHLSQQYHDFLQALLERPELPDKIDDIVVEFGNALYQDVADRYLLDLHR